jgi:hypothetical protein
MGLRLRGRGAEQAAHEGGRGHQSPGHRTQRAVLAVRALCGDLLSGIAAPWCCGRTWGFAAETAVHDVSSSLVG